MWHCGQFLKDPVHVTLVWAWFLQAYIRIFKKEIVIDIIDVYYYD